MLFSYSASILCVEASDPLEGRIQLVPVLDPNGRHGSFRRPRILLENPDEAVAVRKRQGPQKDGINGGEDSGVGADTQRQRLDDGQREAGSACERAHGLSNGPRRGVEPKRDIAVAGPFALDDRVAELEAGAPCGLFAAQSPGLEVVRPFCQMERELEVDVPIEPVGPKRVYEPAKPGHDVFPLHPAWRRTR
jgi:hypothetical protein